MDMDKQLKTMNIIFAISGGLWGVWTMYNIYRNHLWRPKVIVENIDYAKGQAQLKVNNKPMTLYKNSTMSAGFDWGVRFNGNDPDVITRIELVNDNDVHAVIHNAGNM